MDRVRDEPQEVETANLNFVFNCNNDSTDHLMAYCMNVTKPYAGFNRIREEASSMRGMQRRIPGRSCTLWGKEETGLDEKHAGIR